MSNAALAQAIADNPDTVAWLTVCGTDINNAALQTTDNDYCLTRGEHKQPSVWGSCFVIWL